MYHLPVVPVQRVCTSSEVGAQAQTRVSLRLRRIKWNKFPYVVSDTTTWVAEIAIFKLILLGGKKKRKRNALSTVEITRPRNMEFDLMIEEISVEFGSLGDLFEEFSYEGPIFKEPKPNIQVPGAIF